MYCSTLRPQWFSVDVKGTRHDNGEGNHSKYKTLNITTTSSIIQ